jgi:hypothetical protein
MSGRLRRHCQRNLERPPATPQSSQRWRRTAAIEFRAAHGGKYCSIRTRCHDRRPQPRKHFPWARCSPRLHISPSAVGNEKSGALSPTSIERVLALNALVAGPIWPPNRTSDCSTPRRAISLSVNSAREAAIGTADRVRALSSLMFPAPWLFPTIRGQYTQSISIAPVSPRRPSMKNGLHPARLLRANVRFGSFASFPPRPRHVRFTPIATGARKFRIGSFVPIPTHAPHQNDVADDAYVRFRALH